MTNSEQAVWKIAQGLLEGIDPNTLQAQIDEPALRAISAFEWPRSSRPTSWECMRLLEALVACVCTSVSLRIPAAEAYAKGIDFLDQQYPHGEESGSEAALLDFLQDTPWALENLKRAVFLGFVAAQRKQLIDARLFNYLHANWSFRCDLARTLIEIFRAHLPEGIATANPRIFADSLQNLLVACAGVQGVGIDFRTQGWPGQASGVSS